MRPYATVGAVTVYDEMLAMDGPVMSLEIERAEAAVVRDKILGRTFSSEAMDELIRDMGVWVGTRCIRAMDAGRIPHRVTVQLSVQLDGEDAR